jgi:hypothetical protein
MQVGIWSSTTCFDHNGHPQATCESLRLSYLTQGIKSFNPNVGCVLKAMNMNNRVKDTSNILSTASVHKKAPAIKVCTRSKMLCRSN